MIESDAFMGKDLRVYETKMTKQQLPDTIEIDGVKYQRVQEEPKKPQTLHDICVEWCDDDTDPPVSDLIELIARNWLPKPIDYETDDWYRGYNAYRQTLIDTMGGE